MIFETTVSLSKKDIHVEIKEIVANYKRISFGNNLLVALIDTSNFSLVYMNDNLSSLFENKKSKTPECDELAAIKLLHPDHHSFPFQHRKWNNHFSKNIPSSQAMATKNYFCGLKIVDRYGKIKRFFGKSETLLLNQNGKPGLIVCFLEDMTHLIKKDVYWIRIQNNQQTFAYAHQKGKKEFRDIISKKEKEILALMAEHKSTGEIAKELFLSPSTIETHRKHMIKRLGAASSSALIHLCKLANII